MGYRIRIVSAILFAVSVLAWTVIGLSAATQAASNSQPTWFEHVDLMSGTIWALCVVVVWFLVRTLRKIDANQTLLFSKIDRVCEDFYRLQGEHNARRDRCDR